jgi:hypothetical protein
MAEDWITTEQAAELSGYHPEHIRELLKAGNVKGQKFSKVWMIDRVSLLAYVRKSQKAGAKRGPKKKS